jgi:biopolymer transport protein ExbD
MPKIERTERIEPNIPTASMADIVFLLMIFFMVTTVFVTYRGIAGIQRPEADETQRLEDKRNTTHLWISDRGEMNIDDVIISNMVEIQNVIYPKLVTARNNGKNLTVSIIADRQVSYGQLADAMRQLREIDALNVNFATMRAR